MKRESLWIVVIAIGLLSGSAGCRQKPAYNDLDPNASKNQNRNSEKQPQDSPTEVAKAAPPESSAPPPPARPAFKSPSFLASNGGSIVDLPDYPGGRRESLMVGPNGGANTMTMALTTKDAMEKIVPFYEQVIKNNRWTVVDKVTDPEFSEWSLKKSGENTAKITVKKDNQTRLMTIIIVRSEKLDESAK